MSPNLPQDCIHIILTQFQNEKAQLFQYLLVNRTWAECVLPVLWKNPLTTKRSQQLIRTLTLFLPKDSQQMLKENGIELTENENGLLPNPTFDYLAFIQVLQPQWLFWATRAWVANTNTDDEYLKTSGFLFTQEILKVLLVRGKKLREFIMSQPLSPHISWQMSATILPILLPEGVEFLKRIQLLDCPFPQEVPDAAFEALIKHSRNISSLDISLFDIADELTCDKICRLVQAQTSIEELNLRDGQFNPRFDQAIKQHQRTIRHLECEKKLPISPETLSSFQNLRHLMLYLKPSDTFFMQIQKAQFPRLQKLELRLRKKQDLEKVSLLIRSTKGDMQELKLRWDSFDFENSNVLIEAISSSCPRITDLTIPIHSNFTKEFATLLTKCQRLRYLMLISKAECEQNGDALVSAIGEHSSLTLETLSIIGRWRYSSNVWGMFCERRKGYQPINLSLSDKTPLDQEVVSILRQNAERGVIRYSGY